MNPISALDAVLIENMAVGQLIASVELREVVSFSMPSRWIGSLAGGENTMGQVCAELGTELIEFNGEADHMHPLVGYPPNLAISTPVQRVEGRTADAVRREYTEAGVRAARTPLVAVLLRRLLRRRTTAHSPAERRVAFAPLVIVYRISLPVPRTARPNRSRPNQSAQWRYRHESSVDWHRRRWPGIGPHRYRS